MIIAEIVVPLLLLTIILYFVVEYSILLPVKRGLPVLMYHKIAESGPDGLTVTAEQFDLQLMYLREKGYRSLSFKQLDELKNRGEALPKKAVIITFDDGYKSFREIAIPLLRRHGMTATLFVPVAYMGKSNIWDRGSDPILAPEEIRQIALRGDAEIGLHSFLHRSYGDMAVDDMEEDLRNCYTTMEFHAIPYVKVLAYPYGGFPKRDKLLKAQMEGLFVRMGLLFALRIGNRINPWPLKQPYEINRIDIKGGDRFFIFRTKLQKGRAKLFS